MISAPLRSPLEAAGLDPEQVAAVIASALAVFEHDFREHAHGRACAGSRRPTMPVPAVAA